MRLKDCHSFSDFRELARRRLPSPIFNYIDGAADDESTYDRNTKSFEDCDLVPNVLRGVENIDMSVEILGQKLEMPIYCSPTALQRVFHHEGENAVAAAADAVAKLGLKHVVITSVDRDDLDDGGASQFVACIEQVKQRSPLTTIELLIPDFCGNWDALATVMAAAPHVLNHNIETVPRMYRLARPQGIYERSLELLQRVRDDWPRAYSKSGLMVGLGESDEEVIETLNDRGYQLRGA